MKKCCLLIAFVFSGLLPVAAQTTVTVAASADNTIYQNPATSSNALGPNIFSGTNGGGSPRRGLIRFDVASAVPANATITAVMLTLNCNTSRSIADNVSLHKLLAAWGEGTSNAGSVSDGQGATATTNDATWAARFFPSTLWTAAGGDYNATASANVSINSTGFYQWSSTAMVADVQSWLASPSSNFGWILLCNESTISTARKFGSRENATVANRPSLSITYNVSLPVTLTYFKAAVKNKDVLLNWETSQETNNHFFEVLHSRDGVLFSAVGKVAGAGTTTIKQHYGFTHEAKTSGQHFYKLAQVDFDGKRKYSAVERIAIEANAWDVIIFPNLVSDKFTIMSNPDWRNAVYKVVNQNGQVVLRGAVGFGPIDTKGLAAGNYCLLVYANGKLRSRAPFCKM